MDGFGAHVQTLKPESYRTKHNLSLCQGKKFFPLFCCANSEKHDTVCSFIYMVSMWARVFSSFSSIDCTSFNNFFAFPSALSCFITFQSCLLWNFVVSNSVHKCYCACALFSWKLYLDETTLERKMHSIWTQNEANRRQKREWRKNWRKRWLGSFYRCTARLSIGAQVIFSSVLLLYLINVLLSFELHSLAGLFPIERENARRFLSAVYSISFQYLFSFLHFSLSKLWNN